MQFCIKYVLVSLVLLSKVNLLQHVGKIKGFEIDAKLFKISTIK